MRTDAYARIAKWYDKLFEPMNTGLRAVSMKMFPVEAGIRVLDIGCGTGSHLAWYKKRECEIFGIDMSQAMLEIARYKLGAGAHLVEGDASHMPYENEFFDLITATLTFHEMPPLVREAVLGEAKRTIKKDGRILLIDYHPGALQFPKGWLFKLIIVTSEIAAGREHFRNYRQFMANKGLPALAFKQGLSIEQEKIVSGGNMALLLVRE